jgi:hypothetical protein
MADALVGTVMFFWALFGCFVVGAFYLATSSASVSLPRRLVAASYAPAAAAIYLAIAFALPGYQKQATWPAHVGVLLVPMALLVVSIRWFSGPRWVEPAVVYPASVVGCGLRARAEMESASALRHSVRAAGVRLPSLLPEGLSACGAVRAPAGCAGRRRRPW